MPLEPGIVSHIAAMASRFGQIQRNKDKPNQTTKTPQQQAPKPPTHPINVNRRVCVFFFLTKHLTLLCERHLGHVPWSLHLSLSLCTTSDSRPGPGGSRTAASCRRQARRPSAIPLYHSAGLNKASLTSSTNTQSCKTH